MKKKLQRLTGIMLNIFNYVFYFYWINYIGSKRDICVMNRRKFIYSTGITLGAGINITNLSHPTLAANIQLENSPSLPENWNDPSININFSDFIIQTKNVDTTNPVYVTTKSGTNSNLDTVNSPKEFSLDKGTGYTNITNDIGPIDITESSELNISDMDLQIDDILTIDVKFIIEAGNVKFETDIKTISIDITTSSVKIIDSFESGDISSYTRASWNNLSNWGIKSDKSTNGSKSLYLKGGNGSRIGSAPGDGLSNYPKEDEWFEWNIYITDLQTHSFTLWCGSNTRDISSNYGIGVSISAQNNNSSFRFNLRDRNNNNRDDISISDPRDEWYKIRVWRGSDDNHIAQLYDSDESLIGELNINSQWHTTDNMVVIHANNFGSGGRTGTCWIDYLSIQ